MNKNSTSKPEIKNIRAIFALERGNKQAFKEALKHFYNLSFTRRSNRSDCNSVSISFLEKSGTWYAKNFNSSKVSFDGHTLESIIYTHTQKLAGKDRLNEQFRLLSLFCGETPLNSPKTAQKRPEKTKLTQTTQKGTKSALNVKYGTFGSYCGQATKQYFQQKGGIALKTLKKYDVRPVKHLIRKDGSKAKYGDGNFAFVLRAGESRKLKQPKNVYVDKTKYQQEKRGRWLFGHDQLPQIGNALVICAGETDCLCINQHLNKYGIWAVCFESENVTGGATPKLAKELKSRFGQVYVLYDADKTGRKNGPVVAQKLGAIWVDTGDALSYERFAIVGCKDICDIYSKYGASKVVDFVRFALATNTRIRRYNDDPFSVEIPHAHYLRFDRFLGIASPSKNGGIAPLEYIEHRLYYNSRIILQSPAGTGKSTMLSMICGPNGFVRRELSDQCPSIVIAQPTTAIATQLSKDMQKRGVPNDLITGETKRNAGKSASFDTGLAIVVYDQLTNYSGIENTFLVIDEFHQIANDYHYRNAAMKGVWDAMEQAPRVLFMSATPNYLFATGLIPQFDCKLLVCHPDTPNRIELTVKKHDQSKNYLVSHIEDTAPNKPGTTCVKFDRHTANTAYFERDTERLIATDYFTSKDRKRKEDNLNYQWIMEHGRPQNPLDTLYYTTLMEAGVSFHFPVKLIAISDVRSWSKIIQLSTRPRYDHSTGRNKVVDVWLFDQTSRKQAENPSKTPLRTRFELYYSRAKKLADKKNGLGNGRIHYQVSTDIKNFVRKCDSVGAWIVNVPAILHRLFKEETEETDTVTLIRRIIRFDGRFSLKATESIRDYKNEALKAKIDDCKADNDLSKQALKSLLSTDTTDTLQAICYLSKNPELKFNARRTLKLEKLDRDKTRDFVKANLSAFANNEVARILKDVCFLVDSDRRSVSEAAQLVAKHSKKDLSRHKDIVNMNARLKLFRSTPKLLSPSDLLEIKRWNATYKAVSRFWQNRNRNHKSHRLTAEKIAQIVNRSHKGLKVTSLSKTAAVQYLKLFFVLKEKRDKSRGKKRGQRYYEIVSRKKRNDSPIN